MQIISATFEDSSKLSFNTLVNFEFLNGMCNFLAEFGDWFY
jgi:hypothetical protein